MRSAREVESPLVSVIVATRNHAGYLGDCVAALLAQELDADFEVMVIDDHSPDGTESLMRGLVASGARGLTYVRLASQQRPSRARNVGLDLARGSLIAITDSDCIASPGWLAGLVAEFADPSVGIVQGPSTPPPGTQVPLFSHHIEINGIDGQFSTTNIAYRRLALGDKRFDPAIYYWEDVDLGWRVKSDGWDVRFAPTAVVWHQVVPLTPRRWMLWPTHFANWPAKAARHPGFRRFLFLRYWASPIHFCFDIALLGLLLAPFTRGIALLLVVPYVVEFARTRGLRGRFPPAKALAHVVWDAVALASLVAGSVRHRALVL